MRSAVALLPAALCLAAWAVVVWGIGDTQNRGGMVAFNAYDMHVVVLATGAVVLAVTGALALRWRRASVAVVVVGVLETLGVAAMALSFGQFSTIDGALAFVLAAALAGVVWSRRW